MRSERVQPIALLLSAALLSIGCWPAGGDFRADRANHTPRAHRVRSDAGAAVGDDGGEAVDSGALVHGDASAGHDASSSQDAGSNVSDAGGHDASVPPDPTLVPEVKATPVAPTARWSGESFPQQVTNDASRPTHVIVDASDRVWYSNVDAVYVVDAYNVSVLPASALPSGVSSSVRQVPEVALRSDGEVAIITEDGRYSWDGTTLAARESWQATQATSSNEHFRFVDDTLWIAADFSALKLENGAFVTANLELVDITRAGSQYYGAVLNQIVRWEGGAWQPIFTAGPADRINSVTVQQGTIYAGTNFGVLIVSTAGKLLARHVLGKDVIQVLPGSAGRLWAVAYLGGLMSYDGQRWTLDPRSQIARHESIGLDSQGTLWAALSTGLWSGVESDVAAELLPVADAYPGARYFTSAGSACASLLHGAEISGDIACVTQAGHVYVFFGQVLVAVDGYTSKRAAAHGFGSGQYPRYVGFRSIASGVSVMIDRDEVAGVARIHDSMGVRSVELPVGTLSAWSGLAPELSVMIDDAGQTWLRGGASLQLYREVKGKFQPVNPPLPNQNICALQIDAGKIQVTQNNSTSYPYCQARFTYDGNSWVKSGQVSGPNTLEATEGELTWRTRRAPGELWLVDTKTDTQVLSLSWRDRVAVGEPDRIARDGLGDLWLLDSGGGVAVESRKFLMTGTQ